MTGASGAPGCGSAQRLSGGGCVTDDRSHRRTAVDVGGTFTDGALAGKVRMKHDLTPAMLTDEQIARAKEAKGCFELMATKQNLNREFRSPESPGSPATRARPGQVPR